MISQLTKRRLTKRSNNKRNIVTPRYPRREGGNGRGKVTALLLVILCIPLLVICHRWSVAIWRSGREKNTGSITTATTSGTGGDTSSLAFHHSFGLFDDVSKQEWESLRAKTKSSSWYGNPQNPLEGVDDAKGWRDNNMNPTFDCPRMEGVGVGGQQTKLVCNPKRLVKKEEKSNGPPRCLIYSIGSAGDFHFEDSIANMHHNTCEIHVFDPAGK